jgi:hypothetical protein
MTRFWITLVFVSLAACGRKSQAEQLAALDSAYQSGVLTKEEYDAKKTALMGPTAPPAATSIAPAAPPPAAPAVPPAPTAATPHAKGCEEAESASSKIGRESRFFAVPEAKVRRAALSALATLDFTVQKDTSKEIEATKKAGGEREIVRFEATHQGGKKGTRVTVETKKAGHEAQKSWTGAVLAQIACDLK